MSKTKSIQGLLLLSRRLTVQTPLPIGLARQHLNDALSETITLSGSFQYTRRYKGYLSDNTLRLRGPITITGRQFCFLVDGDLGERGSETVLECQMHLTDGNFYQILGAAVAIFAFLAFAMGWGTVIVTPIFLVFIYGMTQWHFQHYAHEIKRLLSDLMLNGKPRA